MAELFATGHVVDGILILMLAEWIGLSLLGRRSPQAMPAIALLVSLGAGAALLLALRAALIGASWRWIALWLAVAFLMHGLDMNFRWSRDTR